MSNYSIASFLHIAGGKLFVLQARPITALPELAHTPVPVPANPPPGLCERGTSHFLEPFAPIFPSILLPAHGRATCVRVN